MRNKFDNKTITALVCVLIFYVVPACFIGFTNFLSILSGFVLGLLASIAIQRLQSWGQSLGRKIYGDELTEYIKEFNTYVRRKSFPQDEAKLTLYKKYLDISEAVNSGPNAIFML